MKSILQGGRYYNQRTFGNGGCNRSRRPGRDPERQQLEEIEGKHGASFSFLKVRPGGGHGGGLLP